VRAAERRAEPGWRYGRKARVWEFAVDVLHPRVVDVSHPSFGCQPSGVRKIEVGASGWNLWSGVRLESVYALCHVLNSIAMFSTPHYRHVYF